MADAAELLPWLRGHCAAAGVPCHLNPSLPGDRLDWSNLYLVLQDVGIDPDYHKYRKDPIVGNAPLQHPGK